MSDKAIWYETGPQRRYRIKRRQKYLEEYRARLTPEQIERRKEGRRKGVETRRANAEYFEFNPDAKKEEQRQIRKYKKRLRDRHMLKYNCETLEQYGRRLKRSRRRWNRLPDDLAKTEPIKKSVKKPKKVVKEEPKDETESSSDEEVDQGEESPEKYIERKRYEFVCLELDEQINKAKNDLKKEQAKSVVLSKNLETVYGRAKELKEFYGIPIASKKMKQYHLS